MLFLRLSIETMRFVNNIYLLPDWNFQRSVIIDFSGFEMDEKEDVGPHVVFILHVMLKPLLNKIFQDMLERRTNVLHCVFIYKMIDSLLLPG